MSRSRVSILATYPSRPLLKRQHSRTIRRGVNNGTPCTRRNNILCFPDDVPELLKLNVVLPARCLASWRMCIYIYITYMCVVYNLASVSRTRALGIIDP